MNKKVLIIVLSVILVLFLIFGVIAIVLKNMYDKSLNPVNISENSQTIEVEIPEGTGTSGIANLLEKEKVIQNAFTFKVYVKLNKVNNLQAGKYEFENGKDNVESIVKKMVSGEVIDETVKLTFVEGKKIKDYAELIAKKTNNTEEDVYSLLKDEEYIDSLIEKYWFLTDDIKNSDIYYALEGYLNPDTYVFENKDVSVKYIFNYVLNYTDKTLSKYKEDIERSNLNVHQIVSLASVVELEGKSEEARKGIAGVFINRLNSKMSLGSDVTTYYAFNVDMKDSDLTKNQINTYNPYNTRGPNMEGKIPVRSNL